MTFSIMTLIIKGLNATLSITAHLYYTEGSILFIAMLKIIMLSVILQDVIMLSVVVLNHMASALNRFTTAF